jgi:hypothetical protein
VLAVALMAAAAFAYLRAATERDGAVSEASRRARLTAQTKVAPLLTETDLQEPITGARYQAVSSAVQRTVLDRTSVDNVTIWSDVGRVLFARDDGLVGTRPTYIRDFVYGVANGTTQTTVESGTVKTFTPIWREPGGSVVVAELDQPFGPIAGTAGRTLTVGALALGLGSLACWILFALSWRSGAAATPRPATFRGGPPGPQGAGTGAYAIGPVLGAAGPATAARVRASVEPAKPDSGLREVERARTDAEARARAAEERLARLQLQHQQAMDRLQALEARLSVAAAAPKHTQEELRVLRDQVRESAERLLTAETENEQLRARLENPDVPDVIGAGDNAR